ncbi:DUF397 domain-containing protein [Plantactinospora sp. B5E13]|uniref:DUF397 domain-containing protein n=1 Tax=Plantactinospora sp. B5E13 TaxID=3153758 RepID=UPI00325F796D
MAAQHAARAVALPEVAWHISSKSDGGSGNCVEAGPVLDNSGRVAVRDSKDRSGPVLVYTNNQWGVFLTALKDNALCA